MRSARSAPASSGGVALAPLAVRVATPSATTLGETPVNATLPLPLAARSTSSSDSPTRHGTPSRRLTPLEKKARDKVRKREQAARRLQRLHEREDAARQLQQAKASSSVWHQKEREEEELVLRRLERDAVFAQKTHPAAAGYEFVRSGSDGISRRATAASAAAVSYSPVFSGYSHARCLASQLSGALHKSVFGGVGSEATYRHPACQGYAMAHDHDSARVSPVFFFAAFAKIPLERVVLEADGDDDVGSDEGDDPSANQNELMDRADKRAAAVLAPSERDQLHALMAARFISPPAGGSCLTCKSATSPTPGCPGCFTFSHEQHRQLMSSHTAQRLKTPKTRVQEQEERVERRRALQRQLVMPSIRSKQQQQQQRQADPRTIPGVPSAQQLEDDYYTHVLVDYQAIRKHRAIANDYVTLHIKTLPVGSILSLRVDLRSSVTYVYELYRAHTELPNRAIHLLLPTSAGLFYLDERIEDATDVRNGLVFGELLLEDFHLYTAPDSATAAPPRRHRAAAMDTAAASSTESSHSATREFLLFSVAVLHDTSTPQLVAHYLQQNFRLLPHEFASVDRLAIHRAACMLPPAVDQDACQCKLLPHVWRMQAFDSTNRQLTLAEQQREREALLRATFLEKRAALLAQRKRRRQLEQQRGVVSTKVRRALAYFACVCETTSSSSAAPQRLEKLWHCFQLFEEWKICKAGRLLDAEATDATLALLKAHQDATTTAFERVLERAPGQGPLVYPVLWLAGTHKLVVRLGTRLGAMPRDDRAYGLLLDLEQDFDSLEATSSQIAPEDKDRMVKRGFTKKTLALVAQDEERKLADALVLCADVEWRASGEPTALFTSSDLLRPPFYQFHWLRLARAYRQAMRTVASCVERLDEYNALARVLQRDDAVLSKVQIAKWQSDVDTLVAALATPTSSLSASSCLAQAARRVLAKKGTALLTRRARQRKTQLREREEELQRLQQLQAERDLPKLSLAQQLKLAFVRDKAPEMRAALELTAAEKIALRASQLLGKVAASASSAAAAAKKEYKVRAL